MNDTCWSDPHANDELNVFYIGYFILDQNLLISQTMETEQCI